MRVLVLTTVMAPYRVNLFDLLGKKCNLYVMFEQEHDIVRDKEWYMNEQKSFHEIHLKNWNHSLQYPKLEVLRWLKEIKPDKIIIYEYSTVTAMILMIICRILRIPYLINCDGGYVQKNILKTIFKKYFVKGAISYIAGGKYAARYLRAYGARADRIVKVNFTSLKKEQILLKPYTRKEKKVAKDRLHIEEDQIILCVGQFVHRKGIDVLLRAVNQFPSRIGVYIIGGTKQTQAQKEIFQRKYPQKNIHLLDFMPEQELREYYVAADVFVLPTREDIWGLVINEAMSCGLPVVTTDGCIAGLELIENDVNGYVVKKDDVRQLRNRIIQLLKNESLCLEMSNNNLKKISKYSYENMAERVWKAVTLE